MFKFLYKKGIGGQTAMFWIAWAYVAEVQGDYTLAEKLYDKAENRKQVTYAGVVSFYQASRDLGIGVARDENLDLNFNAKATNCATVFCPLLPCRRYWYLDTQYIYPVLTPSVHSL